MELFYDSRGKIFLPFPQSLGGDATVISVLVLNLDLEHCTRRSGVLEVKVFFCGPVRGVGTVYMDTSSSDDRIFVESRLRGGTEL